MSIAVGFYADVDPFDEPNIALVLEAVSYWQNRIQDSWDEIEFIALDTSWINRQLTYKLPKPKIVVTDSPHPRNYADVTINGDLSFISGYADHVIILAETIPRILNRKGNVHYWKGVENWL